MCVEVRACALAQYARHQLRFSLSYLSPNYPVLLRSPNHLSRQLLYGGLTYKVVLVLAAGIYVTGLRGLTSPTTHALFTHLCLFMPTYLLWQTFIYFTKTLAVSKYTTQVAAF